MGNGRGDARVAIINPGPPGTCGAVITTELRRELARCFQVEHIFLESAGKVASCRPDEWKGEPVKAVAFSMRALRHWQAHRAMAAYDLYHYMSERNLGLLRWGRVPAVFTCHGLAPLKAADTYGDGTRRRFRRSLEQVNRVDAVIANSRNTADDLVKLLGVPAGKIEVVYFGVNHAVFAPRPGRDARACMGIPADSLVILNVGTERKNKNVDGLLEVFALLAREFDNLFLLRVGDTDEWFTKKLVEMGLAGRVVRPGRLVDIAPCYNAADVYLCMDLHASFGMPNLEAMASGCPVVSSNAEAIPEVVGDACVLVDPRDAPGAAGALREVLASESVRTELRALARAARFRWDEAARLTAQVYARILEEGQAPRCLG
jgi:glycosyltransferase involved in cell wall biosynthesis